MTFDPQSPQPKTSVSSNSANLINEGNRTVTMGTNSQLPIKNMQSAQLLLSGPKMNDEAVVKESFRLLAKQVIRWEGQDDDIDEVAELLENCKDDNGYEFARNLERDHGFSPDADLVEILEGYFGCLHSAHRAAVAKWREVNQVSDEEDREIQAREKPGEKSDKSG